jgi:uncharacterized membrane protein (UPF0127 family)
MVDGVLRPTRVHCCDRFLARLRGSLFTAAHGRDEAWLLQPCNAVHTFMLPRAIDVVFCDRDGRTLRICRNLAPWRIAFCRRAYSVWEFAGGQAARWRITDRTLLACRGRA